jgi:uncharacterized DUF497 family protein
VDFEWDPAKGLENVRKHGIRFSDAVTALEDDFALTIRDPHSEQEERWITLGMDAIESLVVVVYTWRGEAIRIISARSAAPRERRQYQEARDDERTNEDRT